jgi:putative GTP pyrophosphokinase
MEDGVGEEGIPDRGELRVVFDKKRPAYARVLNLMEKRVRSVLEGAALRPTIKGRIKSFDSWYSKKIRLLRQARATGEAPIPINDVVALRAVCPFLGDLTKAENAISAAFAVVEIERKGSDRSFREFGYESIHILIEIPEELRKAIADLDVRVMEVQLRTILQEAWAEVEHELVYKAEFTPFDEPMKRKLAALNANLSLSDIIFQEIIDYQRRLNAELEKRRNAFHGKIEQTMDLPLAGEEGLGPETKPSPDSDKAPPVANGSYSSMDDLLLAALSAHNREDFTTAVRLYSVILGKEPGKTIASVVYKHRGMAYFSQSLYQDALRDFGMSLELDPVCYKAAYYRGVVRSVIQDHEGAIHDFDLALRVHPYHFYSRYRRGMSYWHLGDFAQALADCEAALKLEPENPQAKRLKRLALARLKM